jgi:hypothetical protein
MNSALAPKKISAPTSIIAFSVEEHLPRDKQTFDVKTRIKMM